MLALLLLTFFACSPSASPPTTDGTSEQATTCAEEIVAGPVCDCEVTLTWAALDPQPHYVDWFVVAGPLSTVVETACAEAMTQEMSVQGDTVPLVENPRESEVMDLRGYGGYVLLVAASREHEGLGFFTAAIDPSSEATAISF